MKLLLCVSLLLGMASAQSAEIPKAVEMLPRVVTCKTCNFAVLVPSRKRRIVRTLEFVLPVAAGAGIGFALTPSSHPEKITTAVGDRVVSFCIVGKTC